jgi:hypothetical protein
MGEIKVITHTTKEEWVVSTLSNLKLVVGKRHQTVSPIVHRRNKLITKLHEQIELCEAKQVGNTYAPKCFKTYTNKQTGEKMTVETVKRVKEWFWISDSGKINLAIKYGAKTLTLNKKTKANCIELNNGEELITTLKALKTDVLNGALDEAITEVSTATRRAFGK